MGTSRPSCLHWLHIHAYYPYAARNIHFFAQLSWLFASLLYWKFSKYLPGEEMLDCWRELGYLWSCARSDARAEPWFFWCHGPWPMCWATSLNVNFRPLGDSSNVRSTSPLTVVLKQGDSLQCSQSELWCFLLNATTCIFFPHPSQLHCCMILAHNCDT